jgi:hypothetical protein
MSIHPRRVNSGVITGLILAAISTITAAQSSQAPSGQNTPAAETAKPLVLSGCVFADRATPDQFTLVDAKAGVRYRLYGVKVYAYEGRRVRIVGGLYPSANTAAQAGGIDPTKAAIEATAPTTVIADHRVWDFRVSQVRPIKGACPPAP